MPTFENLIIGAPAGFPEGCRAVNDLNSASPDVLSSLSSKCALHSGTYIPIDKDEAQYNNEIKVINFVVRCCHSANPKPTMSSIATILDMNSFLSRESVENILLAIKNTKVEEEVVATNVLKKSGKLENFRWKVGVALSSSQCRSLSIPYVNISFDIRGSGGVVTKHSAEMSYDQFKAFYSNFERVALVMDEI